MPVGGISPLEQILRQIALLDLRWPGFVPFAVAQTALTVALLATLAQLGSTMTPNSPKWGYLDLAGWPDLAARR